MAILAWHNPNPVPRRGPDSPSVRSAGALRNNNAVARLYLILCCLFWMVFALQVNEARAQSFSHEYPLKAVFILNFARFTDWPTNTFAGQTAPFVIGILGDNPFGSLIEQTVRGEAIDHHKIQVEYYRKIEDIKECDMLFICRNDAGLVRQIEETLKTRPVLTVADFPNAARDGVCIQLVTRNNKIRFRINLDAAKAAHLTMSASLLSLAETVSH